MKKKSNKLSKILFKVLLWSVGIIFILVIGLLLFIQTNTFNNLALDYAVEKLNENWKPKNSEIQIKSIDGNIFSGLKIDSISISVDKDTILILNSLNLEYDIWGLLDKEIRIEKVIVNSPKINLTKIVDSTGNLVWNFSKLISSTEETDTSTASFEWDIALDDLKIENGSFFTNSPVSDSNISLNSQDPDKDIFDFNNLSISDLNLDLNAKYFTNKKSLNLQNFSFRSDSEFRMDSLNLEADINIKDTITQINGLKIITGRSDIRMDKLQIHGLNPFDSTTFINFKDKNFETVINVEKLNFDDVKYFSPEADKLDSTISVRINAKGKYGNFSLEEFTLLLPDSYINFNGNVRNLNDPDSLYLDLNANNLNLLTSDIKTIYKDNSIPDITQLGRITSDIQFTGTLNKFYTKFDINTAAGNTSGNINLDLNEEMYNGKILTNNLDLGKILNDKSMKSNINIYSDFSGVGFDQKNMTASFEYDLSKSTFSNYDIRKSRGKINFRNNNVNLNLMLSSSIANTVIKGKVNIANTNNPVYSLKGKINNLNLSRLTNSPEDQSDLNFDFDIDGRGSNLENINGRFDFIFDNSFYGEYTVPAQPINIEIENSPGSNSYIVNSDMFDLNVNGDFNFESMSDIINSNIELISARFKNVLQPDSASYFALNSDTYNFTGFESDDFDLNYELTMKDTAIANAILQPFGILFDGSIAGSFTNDSKIFTSTTVLNADLFKYQDTLIVLNNFTSDLALTNNYELLENDGSISAFEIDFNAMGDSVIYQSSVYDSVNVDLSLSNSLAKFKMQGKQDTSITAFVNGNIDLSNTPLTAIFDSVNVNYSNIYIANDKDWIIKYIPDQEVRFEQLVLKSDNVNLKIEGKYSFSGNSDLSLAGKDIPLADIYSLAFPVDSINALKKTQYPVRGNIDDLFVNFKGDLENPEITAGVQTGKLVYIGAEENQDIGDMKFNIGYKNESADALIDLNNAGSNGHLNLTGIIPYANPFIESDSTKQGVSGPVDFKLTSTDFEIKYFLKSLPFMPDIGGKLNGEITATGNAAAPELIGSLSMNEGSIFSGMTGMNYKFDFNSSTENSKLVINSLTLSSVSDEARNLKIFGEIDFSGMKLNDIDLNTSGDMVIIDNSVKENESGVYGYLRVGSGSPSLQIKGNLDKLSVTGQLLIVDATISSVPMGGSGYENITDNFVYVSVSDSLNETNDVKIITEESEYYKINPFDRSNYLLKGKESNTADFLEMDVNVKTQKNIYVSIDFDNLTKDRLFGEIETDLNIKTQNKEMVAFGEVNIVNNSYYRFYKDFKLRNSNIFFNGPIRNPELDIQAVYEGSKTSEGFGTTTTIPVQVKLTIKGNIDKPEIELNLVEDGTELSGTDAQADAITFLLFGKYKSELSANERTSIASSLGTSLGSMYISSIVSQTVREILPFLVDAQFKYSEGNITDTDIELTSEIGEATVKVGGKLLKDVRNFEFAIEYPLNNFLNLDLPETLLLIFSREEESNVIFGSSETSTNTGLKVQYRIKY